MIPGIDVSHWQNEINWSEVKRSGIRFAFIKATEIPDKSTKLHVDEMLEKNIQGAQENGIHWSAYHFFRTHIDPVIQAKLFCETVGDFSSMPPVLDLEVAGSRGERLNYKVKLFLEEVKRLSGRRPIIYTSGGFWRSYMCCEKRSHSDWAREYTLWSAQYTNLWPTPIYPWAGWEFWQYTDKGKIPGVITNVDMNWFNGSGEDLIKRFVSPDLMRNGRSEEQIPAFESGLTSGNQKSFGGLQIAEGHRGDYQEPAKQYRQIAGNQEKVIREHAKNGLDSRDSHREEDWIRTYFLQPN